MFTSLDGKRSKGHEVTRMLLLRPTRSLAKKLKSTYGDSGALNPSAPLLHEWYCNDFRFARTDLVLFVNPETFLPLVMRAAPYRDLPSRFRAYLPDHVKRLGYPDFSWNFGTEIRIAKTQDRSPVGMMVDYIKQLEAEDYAGRLTPDQTIEMADRLNKTPINARGFKNPLEMLADKLGAPSTPSPGRLRWVN